jgi:broad specificity phosphatase PhoE
VDLTAEGRARAAELGRRLAEQAPPLAGILASDLLRARRTAAMTGQALGLPVELDPDLRERYFGAWTGLSWDELAQREGSTFPRLSVDEALTPPGGESLAEHAHRTWAAMARGVLRRKGRPFLNISHRGTLRVLLARLKGVPCGELEAPPAPPGWVTVNWPEGEGS